MPSIGDTLREARMRQHLDIADVEGRTKIRAKYLRALENEEFGMLPGPTFVKTFLRTYAEALGLDPQVLVEDYRATYESGDEIEQLHQLSPTPIRRERRGWAPRGPWFAIGLAAFAILAALLVIGLVGGDEEGGGDQAANEPTTTQPKRERTEREQPAVPRAVRLRVTPTQETYVCIDTGPGTPIRFEGILAEPRTFRAPKLRVNLGKTDVELTANGKAVAIEPGPDPVGFVFTPRATRPLPVGERPCA